MDNIQTDYVVIGSGIAGLSAALHLAEHGQVVIITKSAIKESATSLAQGGIAAALNKSDTPKFHLEDTLNAGADLCDPKAVKILVEEGMSRVQELIDLGTQFDKIGNKFDFTKEAAHSKRRILHAADATGKEIERTLRQAVRSKKSVRFLDNACLIKFIVHNNQWHSSLIQHQQELLNISAKACVIATGGYAQLFSYNTNPPVSTGDGIALAHEAGATLQDIEFVQFHPTTLYLGDKKPVSLFLISESVRGEGAVLRNNYGERFMNKYHPQMELAPRDIVARAIYEEMHKHQTPHVLLDLGPLKRDVKKRFPTIYARCQEANIDIEHDFIPVAPAAHYTMGGIKTGYSGQTSIKRLYAAGEAASLGLHGANRLASNSLLDGLVFGQRAAIHAIQLPATKKSKAALMPLKNEPVSEAVITEILTIRQHIRDLMWHNVGIIRHQEGLTMALNQIKKLEYITEINSLEHSIIETKNMRHLAHLMTKSALMRTESRGSHFRSDYPAADPKWKKHIILKQNR